MAMRPSSADQTSVVSTRSPGTHAYRFFSSAAASNECLSDRLPITTRLGWRRSWIMLPGARKSGLARTSNDAVGALSSYISLACFHYGYMG